MAESGQSLTFIGHVMNEMRIQSIIPTNSIHIGERKLSRVIMKCNTYVTNQLRHALRVYYQWKSQHILPKNSANTIPQ